MVHMDEMDDIQLEARGGGGGEADGADLESFFAEVDDVKADMSELEKMLRRLQDPNEEAKLARKATTVKARRAKMDRDVEQVLMRAKLVKGKLENLDRWNAAHREVPGCGSGGSADRTRTAVVTGLGTKLKDVMGDFQTLPAKIAAGCRERRMSREKPRRGQLPPPQEAIDKLKNWIDGGSFYEAQQMYKSISARYNAAQKYVHALDILQSGASLQLKHGQVICGSELAVSFVETLVKGRFPYEDGILDRIRNIYHDFPKISVPRQFEGDDDDMEKLSQALMEAKLRVDSCSSFLKSAIKWSIEYGPVTDGSPELHCMLAEYMFSQSSELDVAKVSIHFVRGNDPEKFASTLISFMGKCYPGEDDLAIARAVLMYLSQGNREDANVLIEELRKQLGQSNLGFPQTEMIQFVQFLLQTLERDALPLFRILRQKYKSCIEREAIFEELLDQIAEKFYGVQRRSSSVDGMFGDIFKMMEGGMSI